MHEPTPTSGKTRRELHYGHCITFAAIMGDFEKFEHVFGSKTDNTYHQRTIDDINHNRQALENELFIDRLLRTLGIDKGE